MNTNKLEFKKIGSAMEPYNNIKSGELMTILNAKITETAFAVVFLDDRVLIGTLENNNFHFFDNQTVEPKYIQRIRVFDMNREFHAWRSRGCLKGRLRIDNDKDDDVDVVVAKQVLFGTKDKARSDGFTEIWEDRGTRLILPFSNLTVDKQGNRIFILTHNYIDYNTAGQATYTDCRFVSFADSKKKLK